MSADPRHRLGRRGEDEAAVHLERLGFRILDRNYRTRHGELDLVGFDGTTIVFCEVKARRGAAGSPWDSLRPPKRERLRRMAAVWLVERPGRPSCAELRFDAIGVVFDGRDRLMRLDHLKGAF